MTDENVDQTRLEAYLERLRGMIAEYGVALQSVYPNADDENGSYWTYTIGLTDVDHPELVIFGLPPDLAAHILNGLSERIRSEQLKLKAGESFADEQLLGVPLRVMAVVKKTLPRYVQQALNIYGDDVTLLQLVWPDKHGAWPDDPEWSMPGEVQPLLALENDDVA